MAKIIPAILESTEERVRERVGTLKQHGLTIAHLDVMDGLAVPNSCWGDLKVAGSLGVDLEVHLMVTEPLKAARKWLELKNVIRVIVRGEEISDWQDYSSLSYSSGGKLGVAFDPESIFTKNINQTTHLTFFLAMGVRSGFSGQAFNDLALGNIVIVKSINSSILIGVDGGMNETTIPLVKSLGVDFINTSSYFWNGDIEKTIQLVEGA
jgi:pentose-5-phosphate-3-epimerase